MPVCRESCPGREHVRRVVAQARRDGTLRPGPCQDCGKEGDVEGHHEDYSKPLDVIWLCPSCHGARHGGRSNPLGLSGRQIGDFWNVCESRASQSWEGWDQKGIRFAEWCLANKQPNLLFDLIASWISRSQAPIQAHQVSSFSS